MILAVDSPQNHHTAVSRWTKEPCVGAGYERQPVITGHRPQKWRCGDSETKQKNPSKYASRWICNHFLYHTTLLTVSELQFSQSEPFGNTDGVRNHQGAGTISRGRFIVAQDVNTARKYP